MMTKIHTKLDSAKKMLAAKKAEAYVDTGVKIIIAIVLGAIIMGVLIYLWNDDSTGIKKSVTDKVSTLFSKDSDAFA